MESLILWLNQTGGALARFGSEMFVQFALLALAAAAADRFLLRRARPVFRCALWSVLLLKLVMPPSLALPVSVAYWIPRSPAAAPAVPAASQVQRSPAAAAAALESAPFAAPPAARLSRDATLAVIWAGVAFALAAVVVWRGRAIARLRRESIFAPEALHTLAQECAAQLRLSRPVEIRIAAGLAGPAVCGLRRPAVLIPRRLAAELSSEEMRGVLLHELGHIQRRDVEINLLQILLQLAYWWNPVVWLVNGVIRRLREKAVDDLAAIESGANAEAYAQTLVKIARLSSGRTSLLPGFLGIMESKTAMTERVERLLNEPRPARHSLGQWNWALLAAAALLFLPWGRAAEKFGYHHAPFWGRFFAAPDSAALAALPLGEPHQTSGHLIWILDEERLKRALARMEDGQTLLASDADNAAKLLGGKFSYILVPGGPSQTLFSTMTTNDRVRVTGAFIRLSADKERWPENPFTLTATPLDYDKTNLFELEAPASSGPALLERIEIPPRGGAVIAEKAAGKSGQRQMIVLALENLPAMTRTALRPPPLETASATEAAPKAAQEPPPLLVRSYKLDHRIFPALEAQLKQPDGSPFNGGRMEMLKEHLRRSGLRSLFEEAPSKGDAYSSANKALFYNEKNGTLLIRASSEEMERIDKVLSTLAASIPQSGGIIPQEPPAPANGDDAAIRIESGFLEVSEALRNRLVSGARSIPASQGAVAWAVSPERLGEIVSELKALPSGKSAETPALTIAPGQQAQITMGAVVGTRLAPFLGNVPQHSVNATGYIISKDMPLSARYDRDRDGNMVMAGSTLHAKAGLVQNNTVEVELAALITSLPQEPDFYPLRTNFLGSCRMLLRESAHVILASEKKSDSYFILISARRDAGE